MKQFLYLLTLLVFVLPSPSLLDAQWVQTKGASGSSTGCFAVSGSNLFAGNLGNGVFLSTDNGTSWTAVNNGLTNTYVSALVFSGTNLFAGTADGVFLSTNNGTSWTQTALTGGFVNAFAINGTNIFAGRGGNGVYLSTDNGTSWTQVNNGLTNTYILALAISGTDLFAGTNGGGIFLSTNNGTSWTAVNNGLTNTNVNNLAVYGTDLFTGTASGAFLSVDNGTSWTQSGLANQFVDAFAISGTNLFAGTWGGVFLSTDNGTSWTAVNNGLTNTFVMALAVSDMYLFAGTNHGEIWRRPLSEMITPVELESFSASAGGKGITLNWSTATETNNHGFEIQRRNKDDKYADIGFVDGHGTTTEQHEYSYTDKTASAGTLFYRLKQIDFNGQYKYSNEVEVKFNGPLTFSLEQNYPNPFNPTTTIDYSIPKDANITLNMYNNLGQKVANLVNGNMKAGEHQITFDASKLASGIYYYRLKSNNHVMVKKMILMK